MNNKQEWNEFTNKMLSNAIEDYRNSEEYKHIKEKKEHINEMLTNNLMKDEKEFVEEVVFELGMMSERETEVVYRQGFKDCVWLLKNLGLVP